MWYMQIRMMMVKIQAFWNGKIVFWNETHKISWKSCRGQWVNNKDLIHSAFWCIVSINSLAPGRWAFHFECAISTCVVVINFFSISTAIGFRLMEHDPNDDKSTFDQVMAWCHLATRHYLSHCWPRWLSPYGVTRQQSVNESCTRSCIYV